MMRCGGRMRFPCGGGSSTGALSQWAQLRCPPGHRGTEFPRHPPGGGQRSMRHAQEHDTSASSGVTPKRLLHYQGHITRGGRLFHQCSGPVLAADSEPECRNALGVDRPLPPDLRVASDEGTQKRPRESGVAHHSILIPATWMIPLNGSLSALSARRRPGEWRRALLPP